MSGYRRASWTCNPACARFEISADARVVGGLSPASPLYAGPQQYSVIKPDNGADAATLVHQVKRGIDFL